MCCVLEYVGVCRSMWECMGVFGGVCEYVEVCGVCVGLCVCVKDSVSICVCLCVYVCKCLCVYVCMCG